MPRTYVPKRLDDEMGPERYGELLAFCAGYKARRLRLAEIDREMKHDEDERLEAERAGLLSDLRLIEVAAREAGGGGWQRALMLFVCDRVPFLAIEARGVLMPTSNHTAWRRAYEDFFRRLDRMKKARDWKTVDRCRR